MADRKISELTNITGANLADDDEFALVDTSADETKAITFGEFKTALDTATGFVRITGDTMTGALDVQSTITADGLTVESGGNTLSSTGNNVQFNRASGSSFIDQIGASGSLLFRTTPSQTSRIKIDNNGDISFYEDTGSTAKLQWSASNERLGLTGSDYQFYIQQGSNQPWYNRAVSDGSYRLHLNGTGDIITASSSGSVGIGTSSPSELIELSAESDPRIRINNSDISLAADQVIGGLEFYTNDASAGGTGIGASIDAYAQSNFGSNQQGLYLTFSTRDSGSGASNTERMRIDSSGNVGIGTSSPQGVLDLGTASTGRALTFSKYNNIFGSYSEGSLNLTSNYYGDTTANAYKTSSTATFGAAGIEISGTGGTSTSGLIQFFVDAAASKTADAAFVPTERMRINSNGNALFGCASFPSASVAGFAVTGTSSGNASSSGASTAAYNHLLFYNGNGLVGYVSTSGSSTTYSTSSDHRLKENVVDLTSATTRLKQLEPKRFNFIADADTTVDGFLAHEVQSVVPEAITGTHNEVDADGNPVYQGIDQSKLVPLLVATIKELEARITALENA
ncbi:MAG: tail fiber domain-containing protein [Rhodospirillales bacterium]